MHAWTSVFVALPVAVMTTFVWMIAVDGDNVLVGLVGIAGSALISWLLLHGVRGQQRPLPVEGDPFEAPPGAGGSSTLSPWAPWPGRIAHALYAWNLAVFLGVEAIFLDGDVTATGVIWILMVVATLAHIAQALLLGRIAERLA